MRDFLKADSTLCGGVCQTFYLFTQGVTGLIQAFLVNCSGSRKRTHRSLVYGRVIARAGYA
jgi:hypothetical protein